MKNKAGVGPFTMTDVKTSLEDAIRIAIEIQVKHIVEFESKEAAKRVEEKVRQMTGQIAATVLSKFEFQRFGSELRITVDFENLRK